MTLSDHEAAVTGIWNMTFTYYVDPDKIQWKFTKRDGWYLTTTKWTSQKEYIRIFENGFPGDRDWEKISVFGRYLNSTEHFEPSTSASAEEDCHVG